MKKEKKPKRPHAVRRWVGMVLACLFLVVVVVINTVVSSMSTMINSYLGNSSVDTARLANATATARDLSIQAEAESSVLLENKNDTLPLASDVKKVNVFGWAATDWLSGGSGSGGIARMETDFLKALSDYGIEYNQALIDMYNNFADSRGFDSVIRASLNSRPEETARLYEPSVSDTNYYSEKLLDDAKSYSDTAFVVFGRLNGESNDATQKQYKVTSSGGDIVEDDSRTQLELSTEEEELLNYVAENYDKVIVVLNTGNVMELGQIASIEGVDACVLAGLTGTYGAAALPQLLWGDISFSAKTADTWAYDFATAASYANTAENGVGAYTGAEGLYPANGTSNGNLGVEATFDQVSYVDYAEGIYVGYKWYETADTEHYWDAVENEYGAGYEGVVQYPFGYGLSYTDFSWELVSGPEDGTAITENDILEFTVKVTNTGDVAGKDVVELYYNPPYTAQGIEKVSVNLIAFAKTDTLEPGESQEVTLSVDVEDMASYDAYDLDGNGFSGYELEAGTYEFSFRTDAHTLAQGDGMVITQTIADTINLETDSVTGNEVTNKFTGPDAMDGVSLDGSDSEQNITYLTRADFVGTFPAENVDSRAMTDNVKALNTYTAKMAEDWIDPSDQDITTEAKNNMLLVEDGKLTDLGYQLGMDAYNEQWDDLLDELSIEEMEGIVAHGYAHTGEAKSVGKASTTDLDGPSQVGGFYGYQDTTGFPCSAILACSWNASLFNDIGLAIGDEAATMDVQGWYAPATNIHRSPFNGRNYEYYSEDPYLSGIACGNTVAGAKKAGVFCYIKHFICNDGESYIYRDSVYTWMTEQALREIYLQPFKILVEDFGATGLMSSYNRIGAAWSGGSTALLTGILRDEWGFDGAVITDYSDHHEYMNGDQMLRAGGDIWMDGFVAGEFTCETESNSYKQALRTATKHVLYMYANALAENQNYVNETGDEGMRFVLSDSTTIVDKILRVLDVLAAIFIILGVIGIIRDFKLNKKLAQDIQS